MDYFDDLPMTFDGFVAPGQLEQTHQGDPLDLRTFEVAANEVKCTACWLIHPRGSECP